jgi:hypothetical protein
MKPERSLAVGDLVTLVNGDWNGLLRIISQPITEERPGYVLRHRDGCILGMPVSVEDVMVADGDNEGFAQLAYNLIQLGSRVIEARLIV